MEGMRTREGRQTGRREGAAEEDEGDRYTKEIVKRRHHAGRQAGGGVRTRDIR